MRLSNIFVVLLFVIFSLAISADEGDRLFQYYEEKINKQVEKENFPKAFKTLKEAFDIVPEEKKRLSLLEDEVNNKKQRHEAKKKKALKRRRREQMRERKKLKQQQAKRKKERQKRLRSTAGERYCYCMQLRGFYKNSIEEELSKEVFRKDLVNNYENNVKIYGKAMKRLKKDFEIRNSCNKRQISQSLSLSKQNNQLRKATESCNPLKILK